MILYKNIEKSLCEGADDKKDVFKIFITILFFIDKTDQYSYTLSPKKDRISRLKISDDTYSIF